MAYDEYTVDRIRRAFSDRKVLFEEKKMIGGMCFMVDNKMCVGTHIDKKSGDNLLMARIGTEAVEDALNLKGCMPMDFTGRPMKGYVFVGPDGTDMDEDLGFWIQKALDFNPLAKASKKRKKKS